MDNGLDRFEPIIDQLEYLVYGIAVFMVVIIGFWLLLLLLNSQLDDSNSKKPDYPDKEMLSIVKSAEERIFGSTAQSADDWLREERERINQDRS